MTIYCMAGGSGQGHETTFVSIFADAARGRAGVDRLSRQRSDARHGGQRHRWLTHACRARQLVQTACPRPDREGDAACVDGPRWCCGDLCQWGRLPLAASRSALWSWPKRWRRRLGRIRFDTDAEGSFGATYPNGCHIAEIEIDPDTGVTDLLRYVAVDDLGKCAPAATGRRPGAWWGCAGLGADVW